MTAEVRRQIRALEEKGDYQGAAALRVEAALQPPPAEQTPQPLSTNPAARAEAIGAELLKLNVTVNQALARIQTLTGELRAVACQLGQKR